MFPMKTVIRSTLGLDAATTRVRAIDMPVLATTTGASRVFTTLQRMFCPNPRPGTRPWNCATTKGRNCAQHPCRMAFAGLRAATTTIFTSGRLRSASRATLTTRRHVSRRLSQQSRPYRQARHRPSQHERRRRQRRRRCHLPGQHRRRRPPCRRRCHLPGRRRHRRRPCLPLSQQQPGRRPSRRTYRRKCSQRVA